MKITTGARIGAAVAAAIMLLYGVMSLSYVAPDGGFKSATSGLASLGRPFFSQAWNVFAPNILKSNIELHISAQWRDDSGELVHSDWVSATDLEVAAVAGQPVPSRVVKQSWNLIRAYNTRFLALNADQRQVVSDTFIKVQGDGFAAKTEEQIIAELDALGDNHGDVMRLLRYDYLLKEYATYLATAYFDEDIERVRWRLWSERPNDFDHRHSNEQQFEPNARHFGWRQVTDRIFPDALEAYVRLVERGGGGER